MNQIEIFNSPEFGSIRTLEQNGKVLFCGTDVATALGYTNPRIARHLAPGGRIVIAIENRLGLKYWAGCTEDHVGKYFEGLENYPDTRSVRTFSRKELSDIIDQAGEFKTTFYYPYPDYKFPMTIYSDKRLPKKGELRDNFCNFDRNRIQLFNEGKVYDSLTDAGLFQEFSNSFLVIVERKENK